MAAAIIWDAFAVCPVNAAWCSGDVHPLDSGGQSVWEGSHTHSLCLSSVLGRGVAAMSLLPVTHLPLPLSISMRMLQRLMLYPSFIGMKFI